MHNHFQKFPSGEFPSRRVVTQRILAGGALWAVTLANGGGSAVAAQNKAPGGFSPERLKRVTAAMQGAVDRGEVDGIVTLLFRRGEVAQVNTVGWQDKAAQTPVARDTIFRIASMTKPVTGVATLILIDDGKLKLDDPIDRWLPEFANPKVLRDPAALLDTAIPSPRPIRVVDLLTHRSGIATPDTKPGPLVAALKEADADKRLGFDAWIKRVAALPLAFEPGTTFGYGNSFDVLGVLVERVAGMKFADVLGKRIFAPLKMNDTAFWVPPEKRARLAAAPSRAGATPAALTSLPPFTAGAGGLVSTVDDYLKFARVLLDGGTSGEGRILSRRSVDYMTANYLTPEQRKVPFVGLPGFWAGDGFGLGVAVKDYLPVNSPVMGVASVGSYGWPGATGVWWEVDPKETMIQIFMVQGGNNEAARRAFQATAYQAIDD